MAAPSPASLRVSCVVVTHDHERFVVRALESVLAQDYPRDLVDVIVVDDGSSDGTLAELERYGDRIRLVRQANLGHLAAYSRGLAEADGDLIALLDGDDVWPPERLSSHAAALAASPSAGLAYGDMELIGPHDELLHPSYFALYGLRPPSGRILGALLSRNYVGTGPLTVRGALKSRFWPIPEWARAQDWWIAYRVAEVADVLYVPGVATRYRRHDANLSHGEERRLALRRRELPFRRWMLGRVTPETVAAEDAVAAAQELELAIREVAATGEELAPAEDAAEREREAARAARARGDVGAALFADVRAFAHDPLGVTHRTDRLRLAPDPVVSIVVPVYEKLAFTRRCLEEIAATVDLPYEVIVVDNASRDGTRCFLLSEQVAGRLTALLNDENLGFGKACNRGVAAARGRYVALLNNDTVPHPGWLSELVRTLEDDASIGLVGARLLYPDGRVQHAGMTFGDDLRTAHVYRHAPADHPAVLEPRDYPAVTGACVLMPRALWQELGGLDEGYRHYVEDVDLCMRVWEAGYRVRYCPSSVVTHFEQASAPDRGWVDALVEEGWQRFFARWWGRWPRGVRELSLVQLPGGARRFAVLALADELVAAPELLAAYVDRFGASDDATLVIYGPSASEPELVEHLRPVLALTGADRDDAPDLLAVAGAGGPEALAAETQALLSRHAGAGALARLRRFDETTADALRAEAERAWAAA